MFKLLSKIFQQTRTFISLTLITATYLKKLQLLNNKKIFFKKKVIFINILTKPFKKVCDICKALLNNMWNKEIITQKGFPKNLKLADVNYTCLQKRGCFLVKELWASKCFTGSI